MENRREKVTKKKSKKIGDCLGWVVCIGLLFVLAYCMVSQYPRMAKEAKKVYREHIENQQQHSAEEYLEDALPLVYGMYVDWYRSKYQTDRSPGELLLGSMDTCSLDNDYYMDWYWKRSESLSFWYHTNYPQLMKRYELEYCIYENVETMVKAGNLDAQEALENVEKYPFMIKLSFNENGKPTVIEQRGMGEVTLLVEEAYEKWFNSNLLQLNYAQQEYINHGTTAMNNMTVILASGSELAINRGNMVQITKSVLWDGISAMQVDYAVFVMAALGIVLLLGLLLPGIRPLGLQEGWKAYIPLELLFVAGTYVAYVLVEFMPEFIVKCQMELDYPDTVFYWLGVMQDVVADGRIVYVLQGANIALWFGIFFVIFLCVINVRQLFCKGVVRFFAEHTLIGRIFWAVGRWLKRAVEFCGGLDFSNKGTRRFVTAIVINYVLVALLCCTWGIGIFLAVPYSLVLLWLIQRRWKKIRTDYTVLLSTTEEMAKGVTDVEYIGEAGIFHELQTALSEVQEGFHKAVQEEVKSQRMKTELITNVSHDLKTPLTAIITYVDLLKNEALTEQERQDYVAVLEQKSARLKTLIEDLFEISKASSGNIQLDKQELDLVQLIQEVQLELEEEIMQSGIVFKVNLPEEKVVVQLDAQKTCRIFENLTMNIVKHGLAGSRAYIQMEQTEKLVHVIYKNISAAEITYNAEEIVERFARGDASRNTEGSGLGLAIVKSFAEAQGGSVKVELDGDLFKVVVTLPKVRTETFSWTTPLEKETEQPEAAMEAETVTVPDDSGEKGTYFVEYTEEGSKE